MYLQETQWKEYAVEKVNEAESRSLTITRVFSDLANGSYDVKLKIETAYGESESVHAGSAVLGNASV